MPEMSVWGRPRELPDIPGRSIWLASPPFSLYTPFSPGSKDTEFFLIDSQGVPSVFMYISIILRQCWIFYHSPPTSMLLLRPLWTPHKCSYRIQVHSSYRWFKLHNTNIQAAFGPCNVLGVHHENTNAIRKMKPRLAPSSPTTLFNNYQLHSSLHHNAQLPWSLQRLVNKKSKHPQQS